MEATEENAPVEFISPDGVTKTVESPTEKVRLRARGWWPVAELRRAADHDQHAKAHLERVLTNLAAREQRRAERQAALGAPRQPARPPRQQAASAGEPANAKSGKSTSK